MGVIDRRGKWVVNPEFGLDTAMGKWAYLGEFSEGLAAAPAPEKGLYGYINTKGRWIIEPEFESADAFHDGAALVEKDGTIILIDRKGRELTPESDGELILRQIRLSTLH